MASFRPLPQFTRQFRNSAFVAKGAPSLRLSDQFRGLATVNQEVSPNGQPQGTAVLFMNMGGPSTTDEVGGFLSRLFVCC
jgi:ferrochelatase